VHGFQFIEHANRSGARAFVRHNEPDRALIIESWLAADAVGKQDLVVAEG
jgi:hypothetical protein